MNRTDPDQPVVARDLPEGTVVAIGRHVYIKRINHPNTPGHEEFWIPAMTYAIGTDNRVIQAAFGDGSATILRVGYDQ